MPKKNKLKDKEDKISYYEAGLNYKLSLKEDELEEVNEELKKLETKVGTLQQRNARLKETRENMMQKALREHKDFVIKNDSKETCEKEDVLREWQALWMFQKEHEDDLNIIKNQIKQLDNEINKSKKELKSFDEYKEKGRDEFQIQIQSLKEQMETIHANFEIMKVHLINDLENTKQQIAKSTEVSLAKQHKSTAEKVFKEMNKNTIQMMHDNKWMEEKINVYIEESKVLEQETANLEKENLELMNKLFDHQNSDFKLSKAAFQNQFLDNENLQTNTILDIDLEKFETIRPKSPYGHNGKGKTTIIRTLPSLTVVKKTNFNLSNQQKENSDLDDEFEFKTPIYTTSNTSNYSTYEIKALGLKGLKKPINIPKTLKEIMDNEIRNNEWPITQDAMLQLKL